MLKNHAAFKNVGVVAHLGLRRFGLRQIEQCAEFSNKKLIIGALGTARRLPARNEIFNSDRADRSGRQFILGKHHWPCLEARTVFMAALSVIRGKANHSGYAALRLALTFFFDLARGLSSRARQDRSLGYCSPIPCKIRFHPSRRLGGNGNRLRIKT